MADLSAAIGQIISLLAFVSCSLLLNVFKPSSAKYYPFSIGITLLIATFSFLIIYYCTVHWDVAHWIQPTEGKLAALFDSNRQKCENFREVGSIIEQALALSNRSLVKTVVDTYTSQLRPTIGSSVIAPLLNKYLFSTGVAFVALPAVFHLFANQIHYTYSKLFNRNDADKHSVVKTRSDQTWGVLLGVINMVSFMALCTSPSFYLFIEPNRVNNCIYTSGHFYTVGCTIITFLIVLAQLWTLKKWKNAKDVARQTLFIYGVWFSIYLAMVTPVLQSTQRFYHDSVESSHGLQFSTKLSVVFVILYFIVETFFYSYANQSIHQNGTKSGDASSMKVLDGIEDKVNNGFEDQPGSNQQKVLAPPTPSLTLAATPMHSSVPLASPLIDSTKPVGSNIPLVPPLVESSKPANDIPLAPPSLGSTNSASHVPTVTPPPFAAPTQPVAANNTKPESSDPRGELLKQIASMPTLKRATKPEAQQSQPGGDLLGELFTKLKTVRKGVQPDNDESEE